MALSTSAGPIGTPFSIKVKNSTVSYHTYDVQSTMEPEDTVGAVGDLYRDGSGGVWVKGENGWLQGEDGVTKHPYLPVFLVFVSRANMPRWVVRSTLRGRKLKAKETNQAKKRLREEDEEEEEEVADEIMGKRSRLSSVASASKETTTGSAPSTSPTVVGLSENAWIHKLRIQWNSPPLCHLPRYKDGSNILDALVNYPTPISPHGLLLDSRDLYNGQSPTMEHIVGDLIRTKEEDLNIVDQSVGYGTASHKEQVLVSMWRAAYAKPEDPDVKLFTVPDIPFHPEGSGKCDISLNKKFLNMAVTDTDSAKEAWSSTLCPPGSITDLHWDYHGGSQVILGVSTKKLWLFWPPTEKNLVWWTKHNLRPTTGSVTLEAIHRLEGLTFLYQQGRQAFLMPPYQLHAVMTFEVSAHSGIPVWDYDTWWDTARRVTEWEFCWAQDYFAIGHSRVDGVQVLQYLLHAMTRWDKLHKKLVKKKGVSKTDMVEFGDWIKLYLKKVQQNLASMEIDN